MDLYGVSRRIYVSVVGLVLSDIVCVLIQDTFDTDDRTPLVTMALLFFMDSFIFYWISSPILTPPHQYIAIY